VFDEVGAGVCNPGLLPPSIFGLGLPCNDAWTIMSRGLEEKMALNLQLVLGKCPSGL